MPCGACAARAAQRNSIQAISQQIVQPQDCNYTKSVLQNMLDLLKCVKLKNKLNIISITDVQYNSYAGYLQSALNYPDNYCYYQFKIEEFQNNILPRITYYVSECNS